MAAPHIQGWQLPWDGKEEGEEEDLQLRVEPADGEEPAPNPQGAEESDAEVGDDQLGEKLVLSYLLRELNSNSEEQDQRPERRQPQTSGRALEGRDQSRSQPSQAAQYAPVAPAGGRELGVVEKFAPKRGFGLIKPDNGGELLFSHWTQISSHDKWPQLTPGMRVEYTRVHEKGRPAATNITAPGGGFIVVAATSGRKLSPFTLTGTVAWFHKAGYGFIEVDTEMEWPQRMRAGQQIYVSREDLIVEEGSPCCLEAGQRVQFKVYKPPDKDVAAAEVTAVGGLAMDVPPRCLGAPLVCSPEAAGAASWHPSASSSARGAIRPVQAEEPAGKRARLTAARELAGSSEAGQERPLKVRRLLEELSQDPDSSPGLYEGIFEVVERELMRDLQQRGAPNELVKDEEVTEGLPQPRAPRVRKFFGQADQGLVQDLHRTLVERGPQPQPLETGGPAAVPCKFFAQGRCNKGSDCPFSHRPDLALAMAQTAPVEPTTRKVPCRFFAQGRCQKGESCPFSHRLEDSKPVPLEKKVPVECEYFAKGRCTRGSACPYAHGPQERFEIEVAQELGRPSSARGRAGAAAAAAAAPPAFAFPPEPPRAFPFPPGAAVL